MNDEALYSGEGKLWYRWFGTWNLKLSAHERVRNEVKWCSKRIQTWELYEWLSDTEIFDGLSSFCEMCLCELSVLVFNHDFSGSQWNLNKMSCTHMGEIGKEKSLTTAEQQAKVW